MKLKNKTALVTGATRGIGRAIARKFAASGVRLVLPWHNDWPEDAQSLQDEFSGSGAGHILVPADLRNREDVRKMAALVMEKAGVLHIVVNNIERGGMPIVHGSYDRDINRDQWQLEVETTLLAKRLVFEACLPLLQKSTQAAVINITSVAAITGRSGPAGFLFSDGYAAANRAVSSLTETWARIGAPTVRVNELMIGLIDSRHGKGTRGWQALPAAVKGRLMENTLLGRTGTEKEVAEAVHFLAGKADFMTGAVIRLDGGFVLGDRQVPPLPEGLI